MYKQVRIDGIETYLFLPEELEDILRDSSKPDEFLRCIMWHRKCVREIENIKDVQYCRKCGHMLQGHLFMLSKKE